MTLRTETVDSSGLWPWLTAAMFAPAAQSLGSAPWPWTLALALGAMAVFLCAEMVTGRPWRCGKVLAVVEYLFLTLCVGMVLRRVDDCWLGAEGSWVIPAVVLVLAACAAERGVNTGLRSGATLFWFIAIAFLVLVVFSLPDVEASDLYPGRWNSHGTDIGVLLIPGVALLLPRRRGKNPWPWALAIVAGAGLISVLTAGALSFGVAAETKGAFFQMVRGIEILGVAERFEALVAAAMTLGWFCLLSLLLSAAGEMGGRLRSGSGSVWLAAALGAAVCFGLQPIPMWILAAGAVILWYGFPVVKAFLGRGERG